VIWVHLVRGYLFGVGLFECHVQERGAESRAPASQVSEDTFYTQRDPTRFLTSVIKWPKSSSGRGAKRLGGRQWRVVENNNYLPKTEVFMDIFQAKR
jgi:hypothetical protein